MINSAIKVAMIDKNYLKIKDQGIHGPSEDRPVRDSPNFVNHGPVRDFKIFLGPGPVQGLYDPGPVQS